MNRSAFLGMTALAVLTGPCSATVTFLGAQGSAEWNVLYNNQWSSTGYGAGFLGDSLTQSVHHSGQFSEGSQLARAWIDSDLSVDSTAGLLTLNATARIEPGTRESNEYPLMTAAGSHVYWEFTSSEAIQVEIDAQTHVIDIGGFVVESRIQIDGIDPFWWYNSGYPNEYESISTTVLLPPGTWTLLVRATAVSNSWERRWQIDPLSVASIDATIRILPTPMTLAGFGATLIVATRRRRGRCVRLASGSANRCG